MTRRICAFLPRPGRVTQTGTQYNIRWQQDDHYSISVIPDKHSVYDVMGRGATASSAKALSQLMSEPGANDALAAWFGVCSAYRQLGPAGNCGT